MADSIENAAHFVQLLEKYGSWPPEKVRQWRALEVLEYLGTPEAGQLVVSIAGGAPAARLTHEAKAALKRLEQRQNAAR